jgi:hypothetical protein
MQSIEELIEKDFQLGETDDEVMSITSEERGTWWPTMLAQVEKNLGRLGKMFSPQPREK